MATLREWLEEMSEGEEVEFVCFGEGDDRRLPRGKLLTFDEAGAWLDKKFSTVYGIPDCPCIVAWTKSWVISVSQYDGSTSPFRVPRNPTEGYEPDMPGG
jgi:hypothetical protein